MSKSKSIKAPETVAHQSVIRPNSLDLKVYAALFILAFMIYANTLGHGFVLDDPLAISLNKNVTAGLSGIGDIITGGYRENNFGGQLYRPISLIMFAIEWQLSPDNPMIHHFFNVFWYALSVCLVFKVTKNWLPSSNSLIPIVIAAIFAVHPIHTEVVANIKSRDEIMSLFFVLASLSTWHQYMKSDQLKWLTYSVLLYFFALLSKETAITMFPIFGMLAYWVYNNNVQNSVKKGFGFFLPVIILFMIRMALFSGQVAPEISIMDNPIVAADGFVQRLATSLVILWNYFMLLVLPYPLSSDYSYTVIPLARFGDLSVIMSLIIHSLLLAYAIFMTKKRYFVSLCIWAYFMAISLFSQIPIVIGTMFGERLAYLASFWWICGLVVALAQEFNKNARIEQSKSTIAFGAVVGSIFSIMTFLRNEAWSDNLTLFTTDVITYPNSVRLNNGAAETTLATADLTENASKKSEIYAKSEAYCQQILKIRPVPTAYLTLGNIRLKQGRYEEAIQFYDQVNDLQNMVNANKALTYREWGRGAGEKEQNIEKSQKLLHQSIQLNDKDAQTWFLLGVSFGIIGQHEAAAEKFAKAYTLQPSPEYAKNAAMAYQNAGDVTKAAEFQKLANK